MKSLRFGLVAIAIGVIVALAAGIQATEWERQVLALSQTQDLVTRQIVELRNVIDAVVDIETGQRGYLLTGQEDYLQPYESGRREFESAASRLEELFRSNPAAAAKVDDLLKIARAKEDELGQTVALRRTGNAGAALAMVTSGQGRRLMDDFRDAATRLLFQLQDTRTAMLARQTQRSDQTALLGVAAVLLIVFLLAVVIAWLSASLRRVDGLQQQRAQEAMHDALTALPNRRYLNDWLKMTLAAARRNRLRVVVLCFDIDALETVNERFGCEAGDRVLQVVALRLRGSVRLEDFVARLGGDQFVAVLPDSAGQPELATLITRLGRDLAKAPIAELADGDISVSIGHASYPEDGDDLETLLSAADRAIYGLKEKRKARSTTTPALTPQAAAK